MTETMTHVDERDASKISLLATLWRRRKWLLGGGILGTVIAVGVALTRPTYFSSSVTLLFPAMPQSRIAMLTGGGGGDLSSLPLLDGALLVPQPGSSAMTATLIVQSRRIGQAVISELHLQQAWKEKTLAATREHFARDLISKTGRNGELYVGFRDPSPALAYQITQTLERELGHLSATMGLDPALASTTFLQEQLNLAQMEFDKAQTKMLHFQQANNIINLPEQSRELATQFAQMEGDLLKAELEASVAQRQAHELTSSAQKLIAACVAPVPGSADTLGPLYTQVVTLESDLAMLTESLADGHPQVQDKRQQLGQAQRVLSSEMQRQSSLLHVGSTPGVREVVIQAAVARARASGLRQAHNHLQQSLSKLPQQEASYAQLQAQVTGQLGKVQLLQQELTKAEIITQSRGPMFVVLDPAEKPLEPDSGGRLFLVALGFLVGAGLASLLPYSEWLRQYLHQPVEV